MKYFLDTEFIEDGTTIDLISIGIVAEDGREFYRQNLSCAFKEANDWVMRNVFPTLEHFTMRGERSCTPRVCPHYEVRETQPCGNECPWAPHYGIRDAVKVFCDPTKYGNPEFWGYYADYDWVAFCQLFGGMIDLPSGYPMFCRDLIQEIKRIQLNTSELITVTKAANEHHALADARAIRDTYNGIMNPAANIPSKIAMVNDMPRRCNQLYQLASERAISDAIREVEKVGAHRMLTDVVVRLTNAQTVLANYIDMDWDPSKREDVPRDVTYKDVERMLLERRKNEEANKTNEPTKPL